MPAVRWPGGRRLDLHLRELELATACQRLLPTAVQEAIFQADLTALVPGTPARPLAELRDTAADREARGGAVTWRFSAASVRRTLDGGHHADGLLAALRERASAATLPQPLELDGTHLVAWCRLREDERMFALSRIVGVAPAT